MRPNLAHSSQPSTRTQTSNSETAVGIAGPARRGGVLLAQSGASCFSAERHEEAPTVSDFTIEAGDRRSAVVFLETKQTRLKLVCCTACAQHPVRNCQTCNNMQWFSRKRH